MQKGVTNHDLLIKSGEELHGLFDCDMCGEHVEDDKILYMWFKKRSHHDTQTLSAVRDIKGLADEFLTYVDSFGNQCAYTDRIVEKNRRKE